MATWVTHLMIADRVLEYLPGLCRHEFCIGNIAPDCNIENEDWTTFTPSREITHWMSSERKVAADCERFLKEYVEPKKHLSMEEASFLWGYYAHLVADAEFQRMIRDEDRIRAVWTRIHQHPQLHPASAGMAETWDCVKQLIPTKERMKDIFSLEKDYLDTHPASGYLTEITCLETFPDYIDYLPPGAIVRKAKLMRRIPQKEQSMYPFIALSVEEYTSYIERAAELIAGSIRPGSVDYTFRFG